MNVAVSAGMCGYEVARQWSAAAAAAGVEAGTFSSDVPVLSVIAGAARGVGLEHVANTTDAGKT